MAYPVIYNVTYSYTGFQLAQGDNSFPGTQIDSDLAGLQSSVSSLALFVQGAMRSDGALKNGIVTYDSLSASLQTAGLAPAVAWTTATAFLANVAVVQNSTLYRCLVAHTSGVFATDLAAGKWLLISALQAGTNGTNGAGYGGTSATSLLIANSVTKVFTTQAGLAYPASGGYVRASSAANGANFMEGLATYSGTTMSIAVTAIGGSGTFADWVFATAGVPGGVGVGAFNGLTGTVAFRPLGVQNGKIVESHASNAATFSLKTLAGADPSVADPVFVTFPDGTSLTITAATSFTASSGSTLGALNATPFRLWFPLINDAGTPRLGVRNCSDANGIYGFPATGILSAGAEGGGGGADAIGTTYVSASSLSNKAFVILGYATYEAGLTTAGTWATSPSTPVLYVAGMPKPGEPTGNSVQFSSTTTLTNSTIAYVDSALTKSITPSSAANLVATLWSGNMQIDTAGIAAYGALRRSGTVIGQPQRVFSGAANLICNVGGSWMDAPGTSGSVTYTVATQLGTAGGPSCFFMTGTSGGILQLAEIMG